jgi:hypothetical protein
MAPSRFCCDISCLHHKPNLKKLSDTIEVQNTMKKFKIM